MARMPRLFTFTLLVIAIGGLLFLGSIAWSGWMSYRALNGTWVLRTSAMVDQMLAKGASQAEARAFVRATQRGQAWMTVDGSDVARVAMQGKESFKMHRRAVDGGCWSIVKESGGQERWCLNGEHLTVSVAGKELLFRRKGAGQMVSDRKPLGSG